MWVVKDEDGLALRAFPTKDEALTFADKQEGWTVVKLPPKPKKDWRKVVGDCLF